MTIPRIRPAVLLAGVLAALVGGVLSPRGLAAPAPPPQNPPAGQNLTVIVVDIQKLMQDSKAARMVRNQIEQKRLQYAREISRQEQTLRTERDVLQREQATLSPKVLSARGHAYQEKVNALERSVQEKRQALEKSNGEAITRIQQVILQILADIMAQRKANLVLPRSDILLFDKKFDVTDQVLQQLDQRLPALTVSFAAPAAPAKPAARAHPAPTRRR